MIYNSMQDKEKPCALALGYFDGVHIGHQSVIKACIENAKENNIKSAVFTFTDKEKLSKKSMRCELYTRENSVKRLKNLGIDFIVMPDFKEICFLSPSEFVKTLCENFSVKSFFCGVDYRFGKNAAGDVDVLKSEAKKYGAEVFAIEKTVVDGIEVSSTAVNKAVSEGNMSLAKKLLGREYSIEGIVVGGKHIGKKRLYPTINLEFSKDSIVPKNAVYVSCVRIDGEKHLAVTNVGFCPTVDGGVERAVCESYIIDKEFDLYGKKVEIEFIEFIREETKFESLDDLKNQIKADILSAKKIGCE